MYMRLRDGPSLGSAALMGNEIICDLQHTSFLDLSDLAVDIQIGFELREREKKSGFSGGHHLVKTTLQI